MAVTEPTTFGVRLRRHREAAGLSQEELAERAGLAGKAIGALERGERRRPHPRTVQLLAKALELDDASRRELIAAVPRAATAAVHSASAFVGRESELQALAARFASAAAGRGACVMLAGEAGIGKTRLAREFGAIARSRGALVLVGRCFEGDWQPPYGPWLEAMNDYARIREPDELRRELGPGAASIAQLVPEVRSKLPETAVPPALGPDDERFRLYDSITQFLLTAANQRPVLLILDDLQWADADSLRVLCHIARFTSQSRVMVLGVYRDPEIGLTEAHPLMAALATLRREGDYQRIFLHGFTRAELSRFLGQTAGSAVPSGMLDFIARETSGNPFYACEVFCRLAEQDPGLASSAAPPDALRKAHLAVPEGIQEMVGRRVAHLTPNTRTLLSEASGFTGSFSFVALEHLSGLTENDLLDCIDDALEAGLIRATDEGPPRYEFAHAIVRHALYDGLNLDRRARLHRRIASALEHAYAGHELENAPELAAQFHASTTLPGAAAGLRYALAAADQARSAFAHDRAATFLRMAIDLATDAPARDRAQILCRLAVAEAESVRLEDAGASARRALAAMEQAGDDGSAQASFLVTVARSLKDGGAEPRMWEALVDRGLELLGGRRDPHWARLTLLRDNYAPVRSGPIATGQWAGQDPEAVAIARASGDEADHARTFEPLEWRSRQETRQLQQLVRTWSDPIAIMRGLDVVARDLTYRHAAFDEARTVGEELLAASERFGSTLGVAEARHSLAVSTYALGDLAASHQHLGHALEVVERLGPSHRLHFATAGVAVALAYLLEGDWPELAEVTARYATSADAERRPLGILGAVFSAICTARLEKRSEALALIRHITPAAERVPATMLAQNLTIAGAAAAIWELDASEHAPTYRRLLVDIAAHGVGDPPAFGPLDLGRARMAALLGDAEDAEVCFARARATAERLGHEPLRAIVDHDEARALIRCASTDRRRIQMLIDRAEERFGPLGMRGWSGRVAALRRQADAGPSRTRRS
jgi:transcriptional regulator with XRE-family HTH domain